jgi:hypothetical protein
MARTSNKKKTERIKRLWERSNNSHRRRWQSISQKGYDFYLDEQLTKDEKDALEEAGMPTFTINRVLPIIEIMRYFVTSNNPRWKAVGVTGDDTDVAQVHSDIADYCWYLSNGKSVYSQVILDSLVKGIGYFLLDVDTDADHGKGEVTFSRVDPYDVYIDPSSRDLLFRDASFIIIKKNLSKTQLINLFPEHKRKIKALSTQGIVESYTQRDIDESMSVQPEDITLGISPDEGEHEEIVNYFECYQKYKIALVNVFIQVQPSEDQMKEIKNDVNVQVEEYSNEASVQLEEKILSIQQALDAGQIIESRAQLEVEKAQKEAEESIQQAKQSLMSQAIDAITSIEQRVMAKRDYEHIMKNENMAKTIVDAVPFYEYRVKLTCTLGDDILLYEYNLPITEYPIVPIPYLYSGTPYPMSAVMPMVGKQQEINKSHQIMLHNANLASNLRWLYQEGSVPEEEWESYSSSPGALLKYRQGFDPPTPVLPAPINNAFYTIVQEGKADAEYISGVPSAMMGFTQDQPETYRGLLANDEFGTRRLKSWMSSVVEPALEHVGRVFQQIAQKHYEVDKIFRIVQPEAGEEPEEKEVRINIPVYNDYGEAIGKWMDYASARFDVRIVAGATLPVNRWALIEEYFRWFQAGLIDDIHMIAETDIRNKKQLLERKSIYSQLQGQVSEMEEALKNSEGTIETLERQLVQAGIKDKIGQAGVEIRKDVLETEAQQKLLRGVMKEEFIRQMKALRMAEKEAEEK